MKPLVDRYNQDKASQEKRRQEAAAKLNAARRLAESFYDQVHLGSYDRFKVFGREFLKLVLMASMKLEYGNADTRWKIRKVLKDTDAGKDPDFKEILGDYASNMAAPKGFGTPVVFEHLIRYWQMQYDNADMETASFSDDVEEDFVQAVSKAVADFRAPIDADKLKALLGLLYDGIPLE